MLEKVAGEAASTPKVLETVEEEIAVVDSN